MDILDPAPNRSPLKAIRQHCLSCSGTAHSVSACPAVACPLWTRRAGHRPQPAEVATHGAKLAHPQEAGRTVAEIASLPASKAVRARCLDCTGNFAPAVKACAHRDCALWLFRMGRGFRNGHLELNDTEEGPSERSGEPTRAPEPAFAG